MIRLAPDSGGSVSLFVADSLLSGANPPHIYGVSASDQRCTTRKLFCSLGRTRLAIT
jgi:hypothetical protein